MESLKSKLQGYLKLVSGETSHFTQEPASKLPLYLRERYDILTSKIFGRHSLLALNKYKSNDVSPGDYEADATQLRLVLGDTVILVIESMSSYDRNRLVHLGVPFIVPASQIYIPMVFMDLRERQPLPQPAGGKKLTPAAQCVILHHLQKSHLDSISMNFLANKVGYSAIMMSKVRAELEATELAKSHREGKTIVLRFTYEGKELWEKARPFLRSPVKKKYWVQWKNPIYPALRSGISALSHERMLSDDRIPAYALWHKTFHQNLEQGLFHGCRTPDEADACIEVWTYNPLVTGGDHKVDDLSLYLSLQDDPDERVQQQLETLIHTMPW